MSTSRSEIVRAGVLALLGSMCLTLAVATTARAQSCFGDCNMNGAVTVDEIITCVNIDLGLSQVSACPACSTNGTTVVISDILKSVNNLLFNCGAVLPTNTPGGVASPTPTVAPPSCPLEEGKYTITSLTGGKLITSTFAPFDFPAGGTIVADTAAGDANCVHSVVVPYPGGFVSPIFCVPALGYTVTVTQTACGIGQIRSNGDGNYTVTEQGDTSYVDSTCNVKQTMCAPNIGSDNSIFIKLSVGGNGSPCGGEKMAKALLSIPVHTLTWLSSMPHCPDPDGDPNGSDDTIITQFDQTLDFTSESNTATFKDLDGDGCFQNGVGPTGPYTTSQAYCTAKNQPATCCAKQAQGSCSTADCTGAGTPFPCCTGSKAGSCDTTPVIGSCLDLNKLNTGTLAETAVAQGAIGSSGAPLFDLLFSTTLPNKIDGPEPRINATCNTNPPITTFPTDCTGGSCTPAITGRCIGPTPAS
jgi:hypothetical protein